MASYLVRILTHGRRGAGTTASVRIFRLTGEKGSSGPFPWMRDGFPTGSTVETRIQVEKPLGVLRELEIGHDSIGDAGTGWLLSGVRVMREISPSDISYNNHLSETKRLYEDDTWFPCGRWLGESDAQDGQSGPTRVVLEATAISGTTPQKKTIQNRPALTSISTAAFAIPEVSKLKQGKRGRVTRREGWAGEDAYFVSQDQTSFGVSDGVSQWRESGVDSGLFARALMQGAAMSYISLNTKDATQEIANKPMNNHEGPLESAAANAKAAGVQGSATIAVTRVDLQSAKCYIETLGDSRVVLVRNGKVVERTIEQEHTFGVPFQLSSCEGRDQPTDRLEYEWDLEKGDIIVCGTDGLFDNLAEEEIASIVSREAQNKTAFDKATALCQAAFTLSQTTRGDTPYSRAANEALNLAFSGGKKDDISAIVSVVS